MPQRQQMPAFEDESPEYAYEHDDGAEYLDHVEPTDGYGPGDSHQPCIRIGRRGSS
jgi:hypothetical protein